MGYRTFLRSALAAGLLLYPCVSRAAGAADHVQLSKAAATEMTAHIDRFFSIDVSGTYEVPSFSDFEHAVLAPLGDIDVSAQSEPANIQAVKDALNAAVVKLEGRISGVMKGSSEPGVGEARVLGMLRMLAAAGDPRAHSLLENDRRSFVEQATKSMRGAVQASKKAETLDQVRAFLKQNSLADARVAPLVDARDGAAAVPLSGPIPLQRLTHDAAADGNRPAGVPALVAGDPQRPQEPAAQDAQADPDPAATQAPAAGDLPGIWGFRKLTRAVSNWTGGNDARAAKILAFGLIPLAFLFLYTASMAVAASVPLIEFTAWFKYWVPVWPAILVALSLIPASFNVGAVKRAPARPVPASPAAAVSPTPQAADAAQAAADSVAKYRKRSYMMLAAAVLMAAILAVTTYLVVVAESPLLQGWVLPAELVLAAGLVLITLTNFGLLGRAWFKGRRVPAPVPQAEPEEPAAAPKGRLDELVASLKKESIDGRGMFKGMPKMSPEEHPINDILRRGAEDFSRKAYQGKDLNVVRYEISHADGKKSFLTVLHAPGKPDADYHFYDPADDGRFRVRIYRNGALVSDKLEAPGETLVHEDEFIRRGVKDGSLVDAAQAKAAPADAHGRLMASLTSDRVDGKGLFREFAKMSYDEHPAGSILTRGVESFERKAYFVKDLKGASGSYDIVRYEIVHPDKTRSVIEAKRLADGEPVRYYFYESVGGGKTRLRYYRDGQIKPDDDRTEESSQALGFSNGMMDKDLVNGFIIDGPRP